MKRNPGLFTAFNWHFSIRFSLEQALSLCFITLTHKFWGVWTIYFVDVLALCNVSSWLNSDCTFLGRIFTETCWMLNAQCTLSVDVWFWFVLLPVMQTYLKKSHSFKISYRFSPLIVRPPPWGDVLSCPAPPYSSALCSHSCIIHWWFLPASGIILMVTNDFSCTYELSLHSHVEVQLYNPGYTVWSFDVGRLGNWLPQWS